MTVNEVQHWTSIARLKVNVFGHKMMHKVSTGSSDNMYKQDDTRRGSRRKKTRMEEAKK